MVLVDYDQYNFQKVDHIVASEKSKYTKDLDTQIHRILQDEELSDHDKCKLYIETLRKYLHFTQEDLRNKEKKALELNTNLKNLTSKLKSEVVVKPAVKRLSKNKTPVKIPRSVQPLLNSSSRKKTSGIPKLKKVPKPIIENWIHIKTEPNDE
jgi:hypothetical protein